MQCNLCSKTFRAIFAYKTVSTHAVLKLLIGSYFPWQMEFAHLSRICIQFFREFQVLLSHVSWKRDLALVSGNYGYNWQLQNKVTLNFLWFPNILGLNDLKTLILGNFIDLKCCVMVVRSHSQVKSMNWLSHFQSNICLKQANIIKQKLQVIPD